MNSRPLKLLNDTTEGRPYSGNVVRIGDYRITRKWVYGEKLKENKDECESISLTVNNTIDPVTPSLMFVPSEQLISYIKHGIGAAFSLAEQSTGFDRHLLAEIKRHPLKSDPELKDYLRKQIMEFFALYASHGRVQDKSALYATQNGAFVLTLEHIIATNSFVRPADIADYLKSLRSELADFLIQGGSFSGAWGRLVLRGNDLLLALNGDRSPVYPPKEKAQSSRITI